MRRPMSNWIQLDILGKCFQWEILPLDFGPMGFNALWDSLSHWICFVMGLVAPWNGRPVIPFRSAFHYNSRPMDKVGQAGDRSPAAWVVTSRCGYLVSGYYFRFLTYPTQTKLAKNQSKLFTHQILSVCRQIFIYLYDEG